MSDAASAPLAQQVGRPTVSAVLPNYNDAGTVGEALDALLAQSYTALEVIVVDDGSTDNSLDVIEEIARRDDRVRVFRHDQNQGPIVALETGTANATGEYIFFPSANDKALPGFLETLVSVLDRYPQAAVAVCHLLPINDPECDELVGLSDEPIYLSPAALADLLKKQVILIGGIALARRSAWTDAGGWMPELKWMADYFTMHVAAFRCGLCYVPEVLYAMRASAYSAAGPRSAAQSEVTLRVLEALRAPMYRDVLPLFVESGILASIPGLFRLVVRRREFWDLVGTVLVKRALIDEVKNMLRPLTTVALRRRYREVRNSLMAGPILRTGPK